MIILYNPRSTPSQKKPLPMSLPALIAALNRPARYVGAIGSRKTSEDRRERLRLRGLSDAQLARIHAPIGLSLGGKTPEEVALSIAAEIVAVRRGPRTQSPEAPRDPVTAAVTGST